jgi:signal transduction histidine kinase
MTISNVSVIILTIELVFYLAMIVIVWRGGNFQRRAKQALILYVAVCGVWTLVQILGRIGVLDFLHMNASLRTHLWQYGLLVLGILFLHLTRAFLRMGKTGRHWWGLGAAWVLIPSILDSKFLPLRTVWLTGQGWRLTRFGFTKGLLVAGWAFFYGVSAYWMIKSYREVQQPLHRNRIKYWVAALGFVVLGDALFFTGNEPIGSLLHLLGTMFATYSVITHQLLDVRQMARYVASYFSMTFLTVTIYTAGFITMQYLFEAVPGYSPLLAGAAMALLLAILFQPLLGFMQRLMNRLIFGSGYNPSLTLRQYSTSISNILDMGLLANKIAHHIGDAMGVEHGRLFLTDSKKGPDGRNAYYLRDAGGLEEKKAAEGILTEDSPVALYLHRQQRPLTQYDIDLLPEYQELASPEREWLLEQDMDVYVPIHAKGEWLGLLALGPKTSGDRYFDDDLALLSTLADQTAVALENARLVEDLVHTNTDLGRAYSELNKANRQLQELDKLKSAFIGVITHELRTPFANITFSLELLNRHGREHLPDEVQEVVDQLDTGVKSAKQMIDNLVTFSTFLSKQGELHPAPLDFGQLVEDSLAPLQPLAESKPVTIHTELPSRLPPLKGDKERLGDAVYHLIHNAIKFTKAGGDVWVTCQPGHRSIRFEVRDNGVGVPSDKLPTLWEDFTQMADPLRRGVEGLGLGLALVKYVINAHGGNVWADSKEGVGSTFGFQLPVMNGSTASPPAETAERPVEATAATLIR